MGVVHGEEMVLNIGPQHPATHGVLRLQVRTDGEVVSEVTPYLGYLHRCFEKHCENVTYEQVIPFTDRCDYLASMTNNFGYVVAMEDLMDIKVNERVEHIRVIMAELQRIASHLLGLGAFGLDIGAFTPFLHMLRDRERILDLFEMTCGARLLYNYMWVGGLSHDLPVGFVEATYKFLDYFEPKIDEFVNLLMHNKIFVERTADIGRMPKEVAVSDGHDDRACCAHGRRFCRRCPAEHNGAEYCENEDQRGHQGFGGDPQFLNEGRVVLVRWQALPVRRPDNAADQDIENIEAS